MDNSSVYTEKFLIPIVQRGYGLWFNAVAYSPDGLLLATACKQGPVLLWQMVGDEIHFLYTLEGHTDAVVSVAFDPNGQRLASGSYDQTIRLWAVDGGKLLHVLHGHKYSVNSVAFDPEGKRLASGGGDRTVRLWDVASGKILQVLQGHGSFVNAVAFDPRGQQLVSAGGGGIFLDSEEEKKYIEVWQGRSKAALPSWQKEYGYPSKNFGPHHWHLPKGAAGFCFGIADNTVRFWDVDSGQLLHVWHGHKGIVNDIAFDASGQRLVTGSGGEFDKPFNKDFDKEFDKEFDAKKDYAVRVWEVDSGQLLHVLRRHKEAVLSVAFDPEGQQLVSSSEDKTVRIWDAENGCSLQVFRGYDRSIIPVAFDPRGRRLLSASRDRLYLRNFENGQTQDLLQDSQAEVNAIVFDSGGQWLAIGSSDNTVRLWALEQGKIRHVLHGHKDEVTSIAFDPEGQRLASGSDDNTVRFWDVKSGQLLQALQVKKDWRERYDTSIYSVAFDPSGQQLATGSGNTTVRLWDIERGHVIHVLPRDNYYESAIAFDPQCQRVAYSNGYAFSGEVFVDEIEQGKTLHVLKGDESSDHLGLVFDPSGQLLAGYNENGTIYLWDVESGQTLHVLQGHEDSVDCLAFDPLKQRLASAGEKTIRLWDIKTGQQLDVWHTEYVGYIFTVAFAPNGKYLVAAGGLNCLAFYDMDAQQLFLYRYWFQGGGWLDLLPDGRFDGNEIGIRHLRYTEMGTLDSYSAEQLKSRFYDPQGVRAMMKQYITYWSIDYDAYF
jgi:WD40 repeat protein